MKCVEVVVVSLATNTACNLCSCVMHWPNMHEKSVPLASNGLIVRPDTKSGLFDLWSV